jgi:hypothetical protein
MASSDSAEPFHERACNGNRERATSGQEQQECQGERWPSGGGTEEQSGGSVVINRSRQDAKTPSHSVHDYVYYRCNHAEVAIVSIGALVRIEMLQQRHLTFQGSCLRPGGKVAMKCGACPPGGLRGSHLCPARAYADSCRGHPGLIPGFTRTGPKRLACWEHWGIELSPAQHPPYFDVPTLACIVVQ